MKGIAIAIMLLLLLLVLLLILLLCNYYCCYDDSWSEMLRAFRFLLLNIFGVLYSYLIRYYFVLMVYIPLLLIHIITWVHSAIVLIL